jgi:hypothetical protein
MHFESWCHAKISKIIVLFVKKSWSCEQANIKTVSICWTISASYFKFSINFTSVCSYSQFYIFPSTLESNSRSLKRILAFGSQILCINLDIWYFFEVCWSVSGSAHIHSQVVSCFMYVILQHCCDKKLKNLVLLIYKICLSLFMPSKS